MSAEIGTGRSVAPDLQVEDPVRMEPLVTAAEALAVFQRKLPDSVAEARAVHHPFWWAALDVRTRGLFRRSSASAGQRMDVLVNAVSGRGMIADFTPRGASAEPEEWSSLIGEQAGPLPSRGEAERTARSLARAKVVKTVKLGRLKLGGTVVPLGRPVVPIVVLSGSTASATGSTAGVGKNFKTGSGRNMGGNG